MSHTHPDDTTTARLIAVGPGQLMVSLDLRASTSLATCTHLGMVPDTGLPAIVRNWPNLSQGEELLWTLLEWLSGHADLPALDELEAGLDAAHWATVRALLWSEGIPC